LRDRLVPWMAGMPAMQEQLQAMAMERMAPMPCGFHSGMAGMPAMQEQLPAMAMERMAPMPCGFHSWMAGMPAMQEQLQAMAMDGRYAAMQEQLRRWPWMDMYACNAGAIAGDGHGWRSWFDRLTTNGFWGLTTNGYCLIRGASNTPRRWIAQSAGMPAMQEQLPAYDQGWSVCRQCRSNCRSMARWSRPDLCRCHREPAA
jgi:hypothetical protein